MRQSQQTSNFLQGLRDGFPICLGYFSVSFAFGITVVGADLPPWLAVLISMTNLTSAGQLAGVTVLIGHGGLIEMALTQFVINLRYALMSFSLTQKLSARFKTFDRMLAGFVITDEIFAVAASHPGEISRKYLFGLALTPYFGWTIGTLLGAVAGGLLPHAVVSALGIAIYGMFIAIVVPKAKAEKSVLVVALTAAALSCLFAYVPGLKDLSGGFAIILCAVAASLLGAAFFPIPAEKEDAA